MNHPTAELVLERHEGAWWHYRLERQGTRLGGLSVYDGGFHQDVGIYNVLILPEYRRQGLGRLMMQIALGRLQGRTVYLYCEHGNTPAFTLYRELGFQPGTTRRNRPDLMWMDRVAA